MTVVTYPHRTGAPSYPGTLYKRAAVLGDSIAGRHTQAPIAGSGPASQGYWSWANALVGSPFTLRNFGYSGDTVAGIAARAWQIPPSIDVVFLTAGTNDVVVFSSVASAPTVTAEVSRITGIFSSLIDRLKKAGKVVVMSTIPPNNAYSSGSDSRISLLDQVNAWINARIADGSVLGFDLFTALWDSSLSSQRVFGGSGTYSSDGTHILNAGAYVAGKAAKVAVRAAYAASHQVGYDPYAGCDNALYNLAQMRTISGVSSTMTYGSGTLASGWRSLNSASGTPTLTLSNATAYDESTEYVGPWASRVLTADEYWQRLEISSAVGGTTVRLQLASNLGPSGWPGGVSFGDTIFPEFEVKVVSQTNLSEVTAIAYVYFAGGTSPVDIPYTAASTYMTSRAGTTTVAEAAQALPEAYRAVWRGNPVRVPENVSAGTALTAQVQIDCNFVGAGSADIYLGRVSLWRANVNA